MEVFFLHVRKYFIYIYVHVCICVQCMLMCVHELMEARKSDRQLDQLQGMLNSRKAQDWFSQVIKSIQDERERSVPKSGFGRLFGFGKKKK